MQQETKLVQTIDNWIGSWRKELKRSNKKLKNKNKQEKRKTEKIKNKRKNDINILSLS